MKKKYETLDEYLDDLDKIKAKEAEETQGMTPKQVRAYYARAAKELEKETGIKLRLRRPGRKASPGKRSDEGAAKAEAPAKAGARCTGDAMKKKYETLDEYLDDLDAIKEQIAEETSGMTTEQVIAYYDGAQRRLEKKTGLKLRLRRPGRKASTGKR